MATVTQNKMKVNTDFDKYATIMGLKRLPVDSNADLKAKIVNLWKFFENTSRQGVLNAVCNALGYDQYNVKTRKIFRLTYQPKPTSTFVVSVDTVVQTQIVEAEYESASSGYIVWLGPDGNYTNILEFIDAPGYSRKDVSRIHAGDYVQIAYQYEELDRNGVMRSYGWVDRCNLSDKYDESFMGWAPETEGDVGVYVINDKSWLDNPANGMKNADGTPTDKLYAIFKEVDSSTPTTWGG